MKSAEDVEAPPQYTERSNVSQGDGLPSYNQETESTPQEPPPTSESLFGRVKTARSEAAGVLSFLIVFLVIILSTIGFTILLAMFTFVPVSMIFMGALYLDDCPSDRMIPIYLIVAGCFGTIKYLSTLVQRCRKSREEREEAQKKVNPIETVVNCFLFAWFIAGCICIYGTKDDFQSDDKTKDDYCDAILYWYAFWINTAVFIIMGVFCCSLCLVGILATCCRKRGTS